MDVAHLQKKDILQFNDCAPGSRFSLVKYTKAKQLVYEDVKPKMVSVKYNFIGDVEELQVLKISQRRRGATKPTVKYAQTGT